MERLTQLLESVQDDLLNLYEQDSDKLTDQIRQWELIRKENAILYAARRQGFIRLGLHTVPTLQSAEVKAREAIEMQMYLQSLQRSPFGDERWTLQQTTRDRFLAPPEYCFKKGGTSVDVFFDNDKENSAQYTLWQYVYYQSGDDVWHKVPGEIDFMGLYYIQIDGLQVYFVSFAEEAARYSQTGTWQVMLNNKPILPDDSVTSSGAAHGDTVAHRSRPATPALSGKKKTTSTDSTRVRGRSGQHQTRRGGRRRRQQRESSRGSAPSPEEVGSRHQTPARRGGGRLRDLLQDAFDPAALLVKGPANSVKCFRFQCKRKHSSLFNCISTTFYWTSAEGPKRLGDARMIIVFDSDPQRDKFLSRVRLPPSLKSVALNLDAI